MRREKHTLRNEYKVADTKIFKVDYWKKKKIIN